MPKSDCLSHADWICNQCKNPKGAKKGLFEKIFKATKNFNETR